MHTRLISLASGLVLLFGCSSLAPVWTDVTPLGRQHLEPTPADAPVATLTQFPTDRKYEELGLINLKGYGPLKDMIPVLATKARALGADAFVIKSSTMAVGDQMGEMSAVAIHFL